MAMDRLETLKAMLETQPENKLARYGLAMEYKNGGQFDRAIEEFRIVLTLDPEYGAAFFHGGQAMEKAGRLAEAREMYEEGIRMTGRKGDRHTQSELQAALDLL